MRLLLFEGFKRKTHNLAGVAVVVDDRILLVHPKKFKKKDNKWSIPKGHIEHFNPLVSALKELKEESGLVLKTKYDDFIEIEYKKSGFKKKLQVYIYRLDKSKIKKYLGDGWQIKRKIYDKKEIAKSKFIKIEKAYQKVEPFMLTLLDYISD
jgi:predicted NUDIX family NTP pyrophosphohydrolase